MLHLIILIWVISVSSSEVIGSINSYCPHHYLQQFDRKFEVKTERFWKFQEESNRWVEVKLPYDLISCRNGNCTKVGEINNREEKMENEYDGFERTENPKNDREVEVAHKVDDDLPLRKRVSLTRVSDMSIWITGESGSIYERFWNGIQWVIAPHDLPILAGPAISIFAVNHSILALSEAGVLYQLLLSESSQSVWFELIPSFDQTTSEEHASSIQLLAGVVPHDGMRVYFSTRNGNLLELTELEPPRWVDHGQPRDADVAAIADVASFRTEIVYTISSVGDLYEYDRSSKPLWKKHVWKDGEAREFRLMASSGCYRHSLNGDHSISLFLLTKDGNLIERRLHKRKWKWIVQGRPNDHKLASVLPALQDESNEKAFSLFLTTSSGFVFEYRTNGYPAGHGQEEETPDVWVNHMHPLNAKAARGISGLQIQVGRILFALDDGRIGELHLAGLGGENSGPTHHTTSRRKPTAKYTWSILDAPESEGWNREYCTELRGPTNCITGTKDDISDQGTRRSAKRRAKGSQPQQNYLIPRASESISEKSSNSFDQLAENWTKNSFRLRAMHGGRSFFLITVDGLMFEYLYTGDVWVWLRHESPTHIKGAVGNYNGSLYVVDTYGSLLIRERSSQELAWTNCSAFRRGKQVIGGAPWDKFIAQSMKVTPEDALFFISKTGRLLQFTVALRKFKWKDCRNPPNAKVASIIDQETFRENIVFVIGTNGRLYQYNKVTELWHEHHQSQHLLLSRLPGIATRPSPYSLMGSLFMISEDGGLIEYHWSSWDGWNWVEHGRPYRGVTLVSTPGPCFEGSQLFLIGSDGRVYLRYVDEDTWKWRNCGFPHQFDREGMGLICVDEELTMERDPEDVKDNEENYGPKVASSKPLQFSEDAVIFELRDGRLAEMQQMEDSNWIWSRIIDTPTSSCIADYWTALAS
ncbi:uncharacterized protein LOC111461757 isoform X1 [Cucurbita moschata]|uniref:Uncharacterized protein LOC111461757 isoform X1 n=2 Tax=Cucurbita moschata TaxID=3662 RepID=A0A6J1HD88_CUCMO|nr:uncharacterized protein LOC111461757 isoform X1 [Cucurbita moschata]